MRGGAVGMFKRQRIVFAFRVRGLAVVHAQKFPKRNMALGFVFLVVADEKRDVHHVVIAYDAPQRDYNRNYIDDYSFHYAKV